MPKGRGGQVCTWPGEVRMILKTDPDFRFEIVALDVPSDSNPTPLNITLAELDERANQQALDELFRVSNSGKVVVQY